MLKELYDAIKEDAAPTVLEFDGRQYTSKSVFPVEKPQPETLEVTTLTGLVEYIKANTPKEGKEEIYLRTQGDCLYLNNLICHVERPNCVRLLSNLYGNFRQREHYITALYYIKAFQFGQFYDVEDFVVSLQAFFEDTPDRAKVLSYAGNVKEGTVKTVFDDGVTQEITAKSGIAAVEKVVLPNPVTLKPYRTFSEVEQPESKFIFRARSGQNAPSFALFEADNGAWRSEAMKNIKAYIEEKVPGLVVIA